MSLAADPGFASLIRRLEGRGLPPLDMYKGRCLSRRISVRMRACGVESLEQYAEAVESDPEEADRLLETLTVNVTEFFRNPETWQRLQVLASDLPGVLEGRVRAWSAGCATGEEAWTVAMVLATLIQQRGVVVSPSSVSVDATDLDQACLRTAEAARYPGTTVVSGLAPMLRRWTISEDGEILVHDALRPCVAFRLHDLGRESPPADSYDLIVCRNVLIYFSRGVQADLLLSFARGLRPGGMLLLGKVETLHGESRDQFESLDARERIFRRLGD